jgi:hypothetical protein
MNSIHLNINFNSIQVQMQCWSSLVVHNNAESNLILVTMIHLKLVSIG